mgnify:CR=1 FL=1
MSAWVLIPCLVTLRDEFNRLAPGRDKGADGSIGDTAHTSSSDHTPDEDSDVLRDHDADHKNEVHALDIDSSGPWPEPFDHVIARLVARERVEYNSATVVGRLKYVIWDRRIASRSWGWTWRDYTEDDPHINHAHFSARYTTAQEADTRPWGVYQEDDMPFATEKIKVTGTTGKELFEPDLKAGAEVEAGTLLQLSAIHARRASVKMDQVIALLGTLAGKDFTDEGAIVSGVLAGLDPAAIAAAIPAELAEQVADELAARLRD